MSRSGSRGQPAADLQRGRDVRRHNTSSILYALFERGPKARIDLATSLGLSTGAVSRITGELADIGVVRELDPLQSTDAGRRRVPIDISADDFLVVGAHIGLQYTTYGLVDLRGHAVGGARKVVHDATGPAAVVDQAAAAIGDLLDHAPDSVAVVGAGVSIGGSVDSRTGAVTDHEQLGWHGVNLADMFTDRLPLPVTVEGAYRAMARAEMRIGAARQVSCFTQLFLGYAIGAAIVVDRTPYDGLGWRAGSVAHLPVSKKARERCGCGHAGCLTSVAGPAATLSAAQAAGLDVDSIDAVSRLAAAGERRASTILRHRVEAIAQAIVVLIDVMAPELVVLSGIRLTQDFELPRLRAAVASGLMAPLDVEAVVVQTGLGDSVAANVVASAMPALEAFYDDPFAFLTGPLPVRTAR